MAITRRDAVLGVLLGVSAAGLGRAGWAQEEPAAAAYGKVRSYADVRALAERMAREDFQDPPRVPERFAKLDYQ